MAVVVTALTTGTVGLICGGALAMAAKFLAVQEDPRIEQATELLPGANCGGCGYAGCSDYAKAIIVDDAAINLCAPGGADVLDALSQLLGRSADAMEPTTAIVLCNGDNSKATRKFEYNGIADCVAAAAVGGGDKTCSYGCLGYGSCSRVCPVGAIEITGGGIAVVHPELCISCGACVKACPRSLIKIVPKSRYIHVLCSSKDKGPVAKKACEVGCIGCRRCAKLADNEAIQMDGFLALVDYDKELTNPEVVEKCPAKCIVDQRSEVRDQKSEESADDEG